MAWFWTPFDGLKHQSTGRTIAGGYEQKEEMGKPLSRPISDFVVQPENGSFAETQSRFGRGHNVFEPLTEKKKQLFLLTSSR